MVAIARFIVAVVGRSAGTKNEVNRRKLARNICLSDDKGGQKGVVSAWLMQTYFYHNTVVTITYLIQAWPTWNGSKGISSSWLEFEGTTSRDNHQRSSVNHSLPVDELQNQWQSLINTNPPPGEKDECQEFDLKSVARKRWYRVCTPTRAVSLKSCCFAYLKCSNTCQSQCSDSDDAWCRCNIAVRLVFIDVR